MKYFNKGSIWKTKFGKKAVNVAKNTDATETVVEKPKDLDSFINNVKPADKKADDKIKEKLADLDK